MLINETIETIEAVHALLDKEPGDMALRGVLADLLAEAGRGDEEALQRLLIKNAMYPHTPGCHGTSWTRWGWYGDIPASVSLPCRHAVVRGWGGVKPPSLAFAGTRRKAETKLLTFLLKNGEL
jgi:hypothetical protein